MTIFKNMGDTLSSAVGGATMVVLATPTDKIIEVVFMALVGGALGAFAKGAGNAGWEFLKGRMGVWRAKRKKK